MEDVKTAVCCSEAARGIAPVYSRGQGEETAGAPLRAQDRWPLESTSHVKGRTAWTPAKGKAQPQEPAKAGNTGLPVDPDPARN